MVAKKSLLKKIFGKSKQAKDANSSTSTGGAGAGQVTTVNPKLPSNVITADNPFPLAAPQANISDNAVLSDSATLDTESDDGSLRAVTKNTSEVRVGELAPLTPESTSGSGSLKTAEDASAAADQVLYLPTICDIMENADVVGDAAPKDDTNIDSAPKENTAADAALKEDTAEKATGEGNEVVGQEEDVVGQEEEDAGKKEDVVGTEEEDAVQEKEDAGKEKELGKKKNRKSWAEERMSQMYASSSSMEKPKMKIEVGHELNAERRKWIEGLSSSKKELAAPHVWDDAKKVGKLSDRMKAVEQALHEKGKDSSSSKEVAPAHTPKREKAAAQRKVVEDMLRRQSDPKLFFETKAKTPPGSPGKASAQRRAVEEMLQKQLDPKAFLYSNRKAPPPELSPGKERLASQKKWVLETVENQNDPKLFLNQNEEKRHSVDVTHENFGLKKDFQEHKK
eukprot:CAMPEP_0172312952 /NCGR_PEP_ID=MMETSP1058-20130122/18874_1 /TAXON_ID=83371 /ORGANISM="Detonula confervacea, Strain CCMP 353" /LENGTH=451 /DNA_ID=CAMNT_0013026521 /DNA_START=92 /DNA_END=1447 /DNA_ORIENTATION=-